MFIVSKIRNIINLPSNQSIYPIDWILVFVVRFFEINLFIARKCKISFVCLLFLIGLVHCFAKQNNTENFNIQGNNSYLNQSITDFLNQNQNSKVCNQNSTFLSETDNKSSIFNFFLFENEQEEQEEKEELEDKKYNAFLKCFANPVCSISVFLNNSHRYFLVSTNNFICFEYQFLYKSTILYLIFQVFKI